MDVSEVERALLALGRHDRAAVIYRGLQSLRTEDTSADQAELDDEWYLELLRRIGEIENGEVELLDGDQVYAHIRAKLVAMRE